MIYDRRRRASVNLGRNPIGDWAMDPQRSCAGADPELWFPANETPISRQVQRAKMLCGWCPVMEECRAYGLATPGLYGIWGGLTSWDRQRIAEGLPVDGAVDDHKPSTLDEADSDVAA